MFWNWFKKRRTATAFDLEVFDVAPVVPGPMSARSLPRTTKQADSGRKKKSLEAIIDAARSIS